MKSQSHYIVLGVGVALALTLLFVGIWQGPVALFIIGVLLYLDGRKEKAREGISVEDFEQWRRELVDQINADPMFPGPIPDALRRGLTSVPLEYAHRRTGNIVRSLDVRFILEKGLPRLSR